MSETSETKQRNLFKDWYVRNAKDFNASRRARYHQDAAYRADVQRRSAEYRRKSAGSVPTSRNGWFSTTYVAASCGVSQQTVRNWELTGVIPVATFGGKKRLYSAEQAQLIVDWYHSFDTGSEYEAEAAQEMFLQWNSHAKLPKPAA